MIRALLDLFRWFADRAWRFARAFSGDDAYERYLAEEHRVDPAGAAISRAAFFSRYLEEKWRRYTACGRSGDQ
jgi:Selenoprotein, putative